MASQGATFPEICRNTCAMIGQEIEMPDVLCVDIGGTKTAAAALSGGGELFASVSAPTPAQAGVSAVLTLVESLARQVRSAAVDRGVELAGIGVAAAGAIDVEQGMPVYAGATLPGWTGAPIRAHLEAALGLPVIVDNDVNALALGEWQAGAGRGFTNLLVVAVGTGVGGALIQGGRLWRGASWSAGELGHLLIDIEGRRGCNCGQTGHLEAYVAGPALAAHYQELAGLTEPIDLRHVAEQASAGDPRAVAAIVTGARILGRALAGVACLLDPQAIIIGGGVAELGDLWWAELRAALRSGPLPGPAAVVVRPAQLGTQAGLVGAGCLAREGLADRMTRPST